MSHFAKRSFLYFYVSFVGTGLQNVIPQVFFDQYYPERRELLLSISLLLGATAGILATMWWNRSLSSSASKHVRSLRLSIVVIVGLLGASLLGLFHTEWVLLFIALFIATKVLSQYLVNTVDDHYVRATALRDLNLHSQNATLFQLVGIVLAPLYFSFFYAKALWNGVVLIGISLLALFLILQSVTSQVQNAATPTQKDQGRGKLDATDGLFLLYIITSSSATLILSANIIYLIQDYYALTSPLQKGGILLGVINLAAIIGVAFQKVIARVVFRHAGQAADGASALRIHVALPVLTFPLVWLLYLKPSSGMLYLIVLFTFLGLIYGLFRMYSREYASEMASKQHKRRLLTLYNNMSNYSIVIASITLFALSLLAEVVAVSYLTLMLWSVLVYFGISIVAVLGFRTTVLRHKRASATLK